MQSLVMILQFLRTFFLSLSWKVVKLHLSIWKVTWRQIIAFKDINGYKSIYDFQCLKSGLSLFVYLSISGQYSFILDRSIIQIWLLKGYNQKPPSIYLLMVNRKKDFSMLFLTLGLIKFIQITFSLIVLKAISLFKHYWISYGIKLPLSNECKVYCSRKQPLATCFRNKKQFVGDWVG
jgi:hypothetical protein